MRLFSIGSLALTLILTGACGGTDIADRDAPLADAPPPCDPGPNVCDFFSSCGCDTDNGEKCSVSGDNRVCLAAGTTTGGLSCTDDNDCEAATVCADFEGARTCMAFCDDQHTCATGRACFAVISDSNMNTLAELCGQLCSLLDQDCDSPDQACFPAGTITSQPDQGACLAPGTGVQGELCQLGTDCAAGFACVTPQGEQNSICTEMCDRRAPSCTTGTCTALLGHTNTGFCF